jgi:hypothetical protein
MLFLRYFLCMLFLLLRSSSLLKREQQDGELHRFHALTPPTTPLIRARACEDGREARKQ